VKILALTVGDPNLASTQYRLGQFVAPLALEGVFLTLMPAKELTDWDSLSGYDLVILQKRLMRVSWTKKLRKHTRKLIFDTDDAIWQPHAGKHSWWTRIRTNARLKVIVGAADACTVPNEHLAAYIRPLATRVELIPMALDGETWHPRARRQPGSVKIGWAGAPPNLAYLVDLGATLSVIQTIHPHVEIHIYCGTPPAWKEPVKFIHHKYTPGTEAAVVSTFDIGLLPLPNDAFAAGKSPIKALQYAACGIPCVASPVGATCEIVRNGETGLTAEAPAEWIKMLRHLIENESERHRLGDAARAMFLSAHCREKVQKRLVACWREIVSSEPRRYP